MDFLFCSQEEKKKRYDETISAKFEPFEKFLGDKQWLVGDKVHYL